GSEGQDTIDHILSQAYVYSLANEAKQAARFFRQAEERIKNNQAHLRGYLYTFRGQLAARQGKRDRAVQLITAAAREFEHFLHNENHHLVASCRMQIRVLGDRHSQRSTLEVDRVVLSESRIRFTDIINLANIRMLQID